MKKESEHETLGTPKRIRNDWTRRVATWSRDRIPPHSTRIRKRMARVDGTLHIDGVEPLGGQGNWD